MGKLPLIGLTSALVAVFVAYVRAIGASAGVGQVFLGPFAKQQRMAVMTLVCGASALVADVMAAYQCNHRNWDLWRSTDGTYTRWYCNGGTELNHIARLMRERQESSV